MLFIVLCARYVPTRPLACARVGSKVMLFGPTGLRKRVVELVLFDKKVLQFCMVVAEMQLLRTDIGHKWRS